VPIVLLYVGLVSLPFSKDECFFSNFLDSNCIIFWLYKIHKIINVRYFELYKQKREGLFSSTYDTSYIIPRFIVMQISRDDGKDFKAHYLSPIFERFMNMLL
jgi:hypothetical protein